MGSLRVQGPPFAWVRSRGPRCGRTERNCPWGPCRGPGSCCVEAGSSGRVVFPSQEEVGLENGAAAGVCVAEGVPEGVQLWVSLLPCPQRLSSFMPFLPLQGHHSGPGQERPVPYLPATMGLSMAW